MNIRRSALGVTSCRLVVSVDRVAGGDGDLGSAKGTGLYSFAFVVVAPRRLDNELEGCTRRSREK